MNHLGPQFKEARESSQPPITPEQLSARLSEYGVSLTSLEIELIEEQRRELYDFEMVAITLALNLRMEDLHWPVVGPKQ